MLIGVNHRIDFRYDRPVFLEPMTVRLRPRGDAYQRLDRFDLSLEDRPAGIAPAIDPHGNSVHTAWFEEPRDRLTVTASSLVQTLLRNPFDYLVTEEAALGLPARYARRDRAALAPCLERAHPSAEVGALTDRVARRAEGQTIAFLRALVAEVPAMCRLVERLEGAALPPARTLAARSGACRDLAVLFIDACRCVGLAARFVSGYHAVEADAHDLHAWAEVYLPGAGWRGYDPSSGLATADRHIAIAAAPEPQGTAPTEGNYRGTGVRSRIDYRVSVTPERRPEGP